MGQEKYSSETEAERIECIESEIRFKGIPAVPGIVFGKCVLVHKKSHDVPLQPIAPEQRTHELNRYIEAVDKVANELQESYKLAEAEIGNVAAILEGYELIVKDFTITSAIQQHILEGMPAETAVVLEYDKQKDFFRHAKDAILRERAVDIENVKERVLYALSDTSFQYALCKDAVVVSAAISPHDVILYNEAEAVAFVTELGGIASHSAILSRSFGITSVIGVKYAMQNFVNNAFVIVDGYDGEIILHPRLETIEHYKQKLQEYNAQAEQLGELASEPTKTADAESITLKVNVDLPEEYDQALLYGAEGVGLLRSEMLSIALGHLPDEQEQCTFYTNFAHKVYPNSLTIRAFDIGSDKYVGDAPSEQNPALGVRGIRYLLKHKDIFRAQIRAVLRASAHKNIRFMLPMVTTYGELLDSIALINECKRTLKRDAIDFDEHIPIGIMIETPSSALLADKMANHVAFFSIGTNDLTQYTLAADRENEEVSYIYDAFNPAVLKLMEMAVRAAQNKGIPVSVCGEFGGHSAATELLLGMGIRELSVSPRLLPELKRRIKSIDVQTAEQTYCAAVECNHPSEVRLRVHAIRKE